MNVLVIDYGMGNLASVRRAFEEVGGRVIVSDQPSTLKEVSHIVLPGVGSFADGMANLNRGGWVTADAVFGQMPADVTHIRFVRGDADRQLDLVGLIGRLKLEILEMER